MQASAASSLKTSLIRREAGVDSVWERYSCLTAVFVTIPPCGCISPQRISKKVVFPDPLGPRSPVIVPFVISREAFVKISLCSKRWLIFRTLRKLISNDSRPAEHEGICRELSYMTRAALLHPWWSRKGVWGRV
ncbi:hypothetical protein D3C72_1487850 [compost metagenome]